MAIYDITYFLLVVFWLLLTVARQITLPSLGWLLEWDWVGLVPLYRFFAPYPGRYDYHFLVRYSIPDGNFTRWFEVGPANSPPAARALFHPSKRKKKAQLDLATSLARELQITKDHPTAIQVSFPYLAFLSLAEAFVTKRQDVDRETRFQFMVLTSIGWSGDSIEPITVSYLHRLT